MARPIAEECPGLPEGLSCRLVFRPPPYDEGWLLRGLRVRCASPGQRGPLELAFEQREPVFQVFLSPLEGFHARCLGVLRCPDVFQGLLLLVVVARHQSEHLVRGVHLPGHPGFNAVHAFAEESHLLPHGGYTGPQFVSAFAQLCSHGFPDHVQRKPPGLFTFLLLAGGGPPLRPVLPPSAPGLSISMGELAILDAVGVVSRSHPGQTLRPPTSWRIAPCT